MKTDEIRALSPGEIQSRLDDAREEYFKLRFQFSGGQLTDTSRLKIARREIARLATILREYELAAMFEGGEE
jgi:large subunit ribosomal protein L29